MQKLIKQMTFNIKYSQCSVKLDANLYKNKIKYLIKVSNMFKNISTKFKFLIIIAMPDLILL